MDTAPEEVLPTDAIKVDGYLSQLQQFWLDAVSSLAAILECAEARDLMPEKVVSSVQVVLCLIGNAHRHTVQERGTKSCCWSWTPLWNSWLVKKRIFNLQFPCCLGKSFTKQATTTVDQLKAIRKCKVILVTNPETTKPVDTGRFLFYADCTL